MDITERKKQYYIDNKERIKEKALKYYYDNKEKRIVYNKGYWDLHKHKYILNKEAKILFIRQINDYIIKVIRKIKNMYTL